MKTSLFFTFILLLTTSAQASQMKLFEVFRTNYFTEKTMIYSVDVDKGSCQFKKDPVFDIYYVETANKKRINEDLNSHNQIYTNPKSVEVSDDGKMLSFTSRAVRAMGNKFGQELFIEVLLPNSGKRRPTVQMVTGSGVLLPKLKRIEMKLNLNGNGNPKALNPLKATRIIGAGNICIVGNCD